MVTYLADWSFGVPQIDEQIVAFQIKMNDIFHVQIFHPKSGVHCNPEPLSTIKHSVEKNSKVLVPIR